MCMYDKQESIPVGCVPLTSVATTRCQYQWGEVGPQVHKFEQVSSDDHQMSVAGGGYGQGQGVGLSRRWWGGVGWVYPEEVGWRLVCPERGTSYHATYPMTHMMLPTPSLGQTHNCENITFPQLLLRAVNI